VKTAISRKKEPIVKAIGAKASEFFGNRVFGTNKMKDYLPKNAYEELLATIEAGEAISHDLAEHISQAMKSWAIGLGATHYSHWFQPLTGATAEKHDAFFEP